LESFYLEGFNQSKPSFLLYNFIAIINSMDENKKNENFLQSPEWRMFQESVGKKTFIVKESGFSASIIKHRLPIIGAYFYCPRGPILEKGDLRQNVKYIEKIIQLAKEENASWIRIEPENNEILELLRENKKNVIVMAPHNMQPKQIFIIDILKTEEELLAEMRQKTRYNIHLAEKKQLKIFISREEKYVQRFCDLVKITAKRDKISVHLENYYKKMIEKIPENMLKLYCAEYEGKIIAANLVVFFGNTAIFLHGASDNEHRNVMAPYLLQWKAILDAKNSGCKYYDFGGIKMSNGWEGITKFKLGFSPNTQPTVFPGSYDIIIKNRKYLFYKIFSLFFGIYKKIINKIKVFFI